MILKLIIRYDGQAYFGWQKTKMGPSVEETLEHCLSTLLKEPISLTAASRTDRGVHAKGQVVSCSVEKPVNLNSLKKSLNGMLPYDIVVNHLSIEVDSFHATGDAQSKLYSYLVCGSAVQTPQNRYTSWHFHRELDLKLMRAAAADFIGTHDFRAFCNAKKNEPYESTIRTINSITIEELDDRRYLFLIEGNHFLYKMVRTLVGTLCYVGCGKLLKEDVSRILDVGSRVDAGMTAPAHGLTLEKVSFINTDAAPLGECERRCAPQACHSSNSTQPCIENNQNSP